MARVLVTGAAGFIGVHLCSELLEQGHEVRAAVRATPLPDHLADRVRSLQVDHITGDTDWARGLVDIDVVIHLAARVHVMERSTATTAGRYISDNVTATVNLARQAAAAGVELFVFLSSIKVNGERTRKAPFRASDIPAPEDSYARSKHAAELELRTLSAETKLPVTVIRPPLVYGPGVRANFLRLIDLVYRGMPLPLASVDNRRSLIAVSNLTDLIALVVGRRLPGYRAYLAADRESLSTPQLVALIAAAMRRRPRLWHMPVPALNLLGLLTGRAAEIARLTESLEVDAAATRDELAWIPPLTAQAGIERTVRWYLELRARAG